MSAAPKHRRAILQSAIALFRKQGYAATGLSEILERSGAPKGSLYHYFPDGKAAIGAEAVRAAGETVARTLAALSAEAGTPAELIRRYCGLVAGWMEASGFHDGCPITTTLLEMAPEHEAIRRAGEDAFAAWADAIAAPLRQSGVEPARAGRLAYMAIAAIEGALVQMRVAKHSQPLIDAAAELATLFEQAAKPARSEHQQ